ncbi:Maf1 regulator-domain-containing protein [Fomitopsis serialis]|uniref:Maf1 regulator-domain-containing protein n=1 Tax=Fomitopsis serialis TaxID=139415 RepID=UPI002008DC67|nr:Maf1 regulator-domain-containing protein [Neoantrodia serialis]KAH9928741.1 Maf1 regulator-domain-containing protein [Neoantrodia serialis]
MFCKWRSDRYTALLQIISVFVAPISSILISRFMLNLRHVFYLQSMGWSTSVIGNMGEPLDHHWYSDPSTQPRVPSGRRPVQAYSCKNIKRDKKLFRQLESAYNDEVSNSPPVPSFIALDESTAFGPMSDPNARKTFHTVIAMLNVAYPDHEFSDVKPSDFHREDPADVLNSLSTALLTYRGTHAPRAYSSYPRSAPGMFPSSMPTSSSPMDYMRQSPNAPSKAVSGTHPFLYRTIDDAIGVAECEVYSYEPSMVEFDPHANDYDDDDDDVASVARRTRHPPRKSCSSTPTLMTSMRRAASPRTDTCGWANVAQQWRTTSSEEFVFRIPSPTRVRMRRRGPLLWSCHYFFYNRKLKRVLFITVWSRRPRNAQWSSANEEMDEEAEYISGASVS